MAYEQDDNGSIAPAVIGGAAVGGAAGAGVYYYTKNHQPTPTDKLASAGSLLKTTPVKGSGLADLEPLLAKEKSTFDAKLDEGLSKHITDKRNEFIAKERSRNRSVFQNTSGAFDEVKATAFFDDRIKPRQTSFFREEFSNTMRGTHAPTLSRLEQLQSRNGLKGLPDTDIAGRIRRNLSWRRDGKLMAGEAVRDYDRVAGIQGNLVSAHTAYHEAADLVEAGKVRILKGVNLSNPAARTAAETRIAALEAKHDLPRLQAQLEHHAGEYIRHFEKPAAVKDIVQKAEEAVAKGPKGKVGLAVLAGVGAAGAGAWIANSMFNSGPSHVDRELARRAAQQQAMMNSQGGPGMGA